MKLLFYIFSMGRGGAERVTASLSSYWAEKGWDITIVTLAPLADDAYDLHPSVARVSLFMAGPSRGIVDGFSRNIQRVRALRRTLAGIGPDIAIAMMGNACATLALAARGLTHTVPIGSIHIHPPRYRIKRVWKGVEAIGYGQLACLTALNKGTASWLAANTMAKRIEVIPNPLPWPLPRGEPRLEPEAICKADRKILLAAGRLAPQKGFDLLVAAFSPLASQHPDWDLAIVGEGPERAALEALVTSKGLRARVFLPGWAGNVADWYGRADLYVLSSRFEGFSLTLAEAMAHGLPVVSFDCETGPSEIIRHGLDGLLVPSEDVPALTGALDSLMRDSELRQRFGTAAGEARSRFSPETVARKWEDLFRSLLSHERKPQVLAS